MHMEINSPRSDSENNAMFGELTSDNNIKLFDVFDDPPHINSGDEGSLMIDTSNRNVNEDDDSFGYDSIFQSRIEQPKQVQPSPDIRPVLGGHEDEAASIGASKDDDAVHNNDKLCEVEESIVKNIAADDEYNVVVGKNEGHREEVISNDKEDLEDSTENSFEKVGIWTFSGGAAKKSSSAKKSNSKKPTTLYEKEKFAIHSEAQRLIRETSADLLYYKPKEYSSIAEFKKALHGDKASAIPTLRSLGTREIKASQNPAPFPSSVAPATSPWSLTERILLGGNFKLPEKLPPPRLLKANDDDVIDLFQDDQPVIPGKRTKAEELLSRFHKFAKPTDFKDSAESSKAQELSVPIKVSGAKASRDSLKMESEDYKMSRKKSLTFTNRHEWAKHRAELKEIIRAKKLKQYEERMKDQKPSQYSGNNAANNESDEDDEWLEGDETSCSSPSLSESDVGDDEDEIDDETPHISHVNQKTNPFIDDEAAEDDGSEDENSEDENDKQFPSDDHPPLIRPIHNPHLEPGDVDLFASDSITQTVQGDGTSPSLLDRSWNATPYSLLYSQKRLSSDTTDSLSLEQTNIEPTAPATSETLVATDPTQFMTVQGGLDDYSVVKVELNLTQLGGSKLPTEGPTQTQLIDDFEDNQPLTIPLSSSKEFNKPKLVRVRDSSCIMTSKGSAFPHSPAESTQLVPSNGVKYTPFADSDLIQNNGVDLSQTQLFKDASSSAILLHKEPSAEEITRPKLKRIRDVCKTSAFNEPPSLPDTQELPLEADFRGELSQPKLDLLDPSYIQCSFATQTPYSTILLHKEPSMEEITRPKLKRIRDVCKTSAFNEPPSLPDTQELPLEADFRGELSQPKLDLLDPSYIQCSFATQAMVDPLAPRAVEEPHKPRKRLRLNSDEESNEEARDLESPFKRQATFNSTEPLDAIENAPSPTDENVGAASSATEGNDEDIDNVEDIDDGVTIEEAEEVEEFSSDEDEEREYLKQIREAKLSDKLKKHPKFRPTDFIEEEAELSGDEEERAIYGDGRDEELDDEDDAQSLKDFVDENYADDRTGKLRREIERVYNRIQEDEDRRNLRYLKEMFFEDGDLYDEEGQVRRRRFRWKGLDDEDPFAIRRVDLDAEETEDDGSEIRASVGLAGFMSRRLLHGVSVEENPSSDGVKDVATDRPRDEDTPASGNLSAEAATETLTSVEFSESIISALGRKVISSHRSGSVAFRSPKAKGILDPLQKTLPGMLQKSSSTSDLLQPSRPILTTKRGSLLSHPAPVLPAPARSRSLLPIGRLSQQFPTANTEMEVDNDAENDSGTANRNHVGHSAFSLRTKVGLSCFSARTNSDATPVTNRSHFVKPPGAQSAKASTPFNSLLKSLQSNKSEKLTPKSIFKSLK